ncbi:MAG: hypothetical protein ACRETN_09370 [Nevskiales bacterium]
MFDAKSLIVEYEFDGFSLFANLTEYGKEVAFNNSTAPQRGAAGGMPSFPLVPSYPRTRVSFGGEVTRFPLARE